jgi:hypothetical protein
MLTIQIIVCRKTLLIILFYTKPTSINNLIFISNEDLFAVRLIWYKGSEPQDKQDEIS